MEQRGPGDAAPARAFSLGPWREIADRVFVRVGQPDAVNLGLVLGRTGALLVDTGSSPAQGARLRASVAELTDRPLVGVVVTHAHSDHAFGLAAFADRPSTGHETLAARLAEPPAREAAGALGVDPDTLRPPRRGIAVAAAFDLGERRVEVAHLGAGHTDGDLVVLVPDADVLFAGDLVESAGPPWYGPDSDPHAWPATLDGLVGMMTDRTRAVPGHGDPVDREFVFDARGRTAAVAGEIRRLAEAGVAEEDALAAGSWPYPAEHVAAGIAPGYAQLADRVRGGRRSLPLA